MLAIDEIVNFERYPIQDLADSRARQVIDDARQQLRRNDLCLLPEFIRAPALEVMREDAAGLMDSAHFTEHWRATPNGPDESRLPRQTRASIGAVAQDQISAESALRQLYAWNGLNAFIAAVYESGPLFQTDDPLVSCMVTVFRKGDELGWHYDPNDGVVSLLLQECAAGGSFEFAPRIRGEQEPNISGEMAVLDETSPNVIIERPAPGTLSLFNGYRSLHRVAPVQSEPPRIMALFNYAAEPGYHFEERIHRNFFGRTATP